MKREPAVKITKEILQRAARARLYQIDFARFAVEQLKVRPKEPGPLRAFKLNPPQAVLDQVIEEQVKEEGRIRACILKARQQGISTYTSGRDFHGTALFPNIYNLVIAQDRDTSKGIFEINRVFHDNLHPDVRPMTRYVSKEELVFENPDERSRAQFPGLRSLIRFQTAGNQQAGTGRTIHKLHLSECAKYGNAEIVTQSLFPAVPNAPGTSIIIESTAFPTGDWFRDFCDRAASNKDQYRFIFLPWFLSPEYAMPMPKGQKSLFHLDVEERRLVKDYNLTHQQLYFRRRTIEQWGSGTWPNVEEAAVDRFRCEFPANPEEAWTTWDAAAFDKQKMIGLRRQCAGPKRRCDIITRPEGGYVIRDNPQGMLWIWEEPQQGELYDIGADIATGSADGDWTVAEVVKRRTHEQVAELRAHIGPLDFVPPLAQLGYYYNTAQIGVEIDGVGFATNDALIKGGYPYPYIWRHRAKLSGTLSQFTGWKSGGRDAKPYMISLMRHLLMHDQLPIRSMILWEEMNHYAVFQTYAGEEYRHGSGYHDDTIMAFAIALVIGEDESSGAPLERSKTCEHRVKVQLPGQKSGMLTCVSCGEATPYRDPALHDDDRPLSARQTRSALDNMIDSLQGDDG